MIIRYEATSPWARDTDGLVASMTIYLPKAMQGDDWPGELGFRQHVETEAGYAELKREHDARRKQLEAGRSTMSEEDVSAEERHLFGDARRLHSLNPANLHKVPVLVTGRLPLPQMSREVLLPLSDDQCAALRAAVATMVTRGALDEEEPTRIIDGGTFHLSIESPCHRVALSWMGSSPPGVKELTAALMDVWEQVGAKQMLLDASAAMRSERHQRRERQQSNQ